MTWIDPEINGTMRSERLIICATVRCGVGSGVCATYGNLHSKLLDRDAQKIFLEVTSKRHRFLQESRVLRLAQLNIRFPLCTTVSVLSVASTQLTGLI